MAKNANVTPSVDPSSILTGTAVNIPLPTFSQIWHDKKHISVAEAIQIVVSQFVDVPGLPKVGERGWHRDFAIALIGESGVSKTVSIEAAARSNDLDFAVMDFAGTEVGDALPINEMAEDPDHPGQHRKLTFGKYYRRPEGKRGLGILLINEGLGASVDQQKQMRAFISKRELAGGRIDDGWVFIMDANPVIAKYFSNKSLDYSLEHRLFCLPVGPSYEATMRRWSSAPGTCFAPVIPDKIKDVDLAPWGVNGQIYDFLRMNGDYHNCGYDRRWDMFSILYTRILAAGICNEITVSRFIDLVWPDDIATAFKKSLSRGTDQRYWPIRGDVLLNTKSTEHKKLMDVMTAWKTDDNLNFMLGFTLLNVIDYIVGLEVKLTETQLARMVEFAGLLTNDQISRLAMGPTAYKVPANSDLLWDKLYTKYENVLQETASMGREASAMARKMST